MVTKNQKDRILNCSCYQADKENPSMPNIYGVEFRNDSKTPFSGLDVIWYEQDEFEYLVLGSLSLKEILREHPNDFENRNLPFLKRDVAFLEKSFGIKIPLPEDCDESFMGFIQIHSVKDDLLAQIERCIVFYFSDYDHIVNRAKRLKEFIEFLIVELETPEIFHHYLYNFKWLPGFSLGIEEQRQKSEISNPIRLVKNNKSNPDDDKVTYKVLYIAGEYSCELEETRTKAQMLQKEFDDILRDFFYYYNKKYYRELNRFGKSITVIDRFKLYKGQLDHWLKQIEVDKGRKTEWKKAQLLKNVDDVFLAYSPWWLKKGYRYEGRRETRIFNEQHYRIIANKFRKTVLDIVDGEIEKAAYRRYPAIQIPESIKKLLKSKQ